MTAKSEHPMGFQEVSDSTFRTSLTQFTECHRNFLQERIALCNFHSLLTISGVIFKSCTNKHITGLCV